MYEEEQMEDKSKYKVSLRGIEDEDTTPISTYFGGGGHRGASSFGVDKSTFDKWKV